MGGIPYQSQGCTACRKRKVKCDLGSPQCMRCIKRRISCPGYEKGRFILYQDANAASEGGRQQPLMLSPVMPASSTYRSQIFSKFLESSFPLEIVSSDEIDILPSLIVNISTRPVKSEMLERALAAIACIYLGRTHADTHLTQIGIQHYNIAIRHMSQLLSHQVQTEDMIYTTVAFQMIQSFHCPYGLRVWLAHMAGTNALLRHCYQNRSIEAPINDIYRKLQKMMMIYSTVVMEWPKEDYRCLQQYSSRGTPLDDLFELFAVEASLLSTTGRINHSDSQACETFLRTCLSHRERILRWYCQNQSYIGGSPITCDPREIECRIPLGDDLFGAPYLFKTLDHLRLHVLYWTALTMVQSLIYQAKILVLANSDSSSIFPVDPGSHEEYLLAAHYAGQICKTIPFCLQPRMKLAGARAIIASIPHICKPFIHLRDERKFLWCQNVSSVLDDFGFHMATQLRRTASQYWDLSEDPNINSALSLSLRWDISEDMSGGL